MLCFGFLALCSVSLSLSFATTLGCCFLFKPLPHFLTFHFSVMPTLPSSLVSNSVAIVFLHLFCFFFFGSGVNELHTSSHSLSLLVDDTYGETTFSHCFFLLSLVSSFWKKIINYITVNDQEIVFTLIGKPVLVLLQ